MARAGRRPGQSRTREQILAAAGRLFAERGYHGATVRSIADAASVNPALIRHYFGTKDQLFLAVLQFPVNPPEIVAELMASGGRGRLPERLAARFIAAWRDPVTGPALQAALRRAMTDPDYAAMLGSLAETAFIPRVADTIGTTELNAAVAVGSLVGVMIAATILRLAPLERASDSELASLLGPAVAASLSEVVKG